MGLYEEGFANCCAYDIRRNNSTYANLINKRANASQTKIKKNLVNLVSGCDIIISSVTAKSALVVATEVKKIIGKGQFFLDINSVSPDTKRKIANIFDKGDPSLFVEAAVMAAFPALKHKTPILICGPHVPAFMRTVKKYNVDLTDTGRDFGNASAIKMFRSIIIKGIEAILQESMLGASAYGVSEMVLKSVQNSYPGIDWEYLTTYLLGRTVIHGQRRAEEMREANATLRHLVVNPIITEAIANRIQIAANAWLRQAPKNEGPDHYQEILDVIKKYETFQNDKLQS